MKIALSITFALLAASAPALAQNDTAGAAREGGQTSDAERVRCRNVFTVNSRIPERICRTNAEWERIERESREAMDRNRRGAGASGDSRGS